MYIYININFDILLYIGWFIRSLVTIKKGWFYSKLDGL